MSKIIGSTLYAPAGKAPGPKASLTPKSGVAYTSGLSGIEPATLTILSQAISNNADITSATNTVYVDYNTTHAKIDIGNQVTLALNGVNYVFDVIGFNHDTLTTPTAYGATTKTGKAGITFQMHDLFATGYKMNSSETNKGGWKSSEMRTSTMPLMKGYLPAAWQTVIKPVNKISGIGGGATSGTETISDDLFLLAEIEVFGTITWSVSGEGMQYAYYKAGNSKIKKKGGSTSVWWERSPRPAVDYSFCSVADGGYAVDRLPNYNFGVAFAFCI